MQFLKIYNFVISLRCGEHETSDWNLRLYFYREIGKDRNADIQVARVQTNFTQKILNSNQRKQIRKQ